MKTGVITFDFFPYIGGIGRFTFLMYQELGQDDFLYFSPADNELPGHVRVKFWAVRFVKQVGVSLWFLLNARRIIAKYGLERVNIHTGPGGVLNLRRLPVTTIVTCHHTYWQQYSYIPSQFWKRIFLPFEQRTYRLADRIVCDCEDTRKVLIERYRVAPEKISVVYCAVDREKFRPLGLPKTPNTVVYVGRIEKRKGIDFLIRSMPQVVKQLPEVRLLVGGKGSYLERMKREVERLGLERNVSFLGFVPDDQLNELYNRAQCAVVPSVFEGFGITCIEALAAGTRVVGTDVDGIREILLSGEYGRLAPYGDEGALAEAIVAELKSPRNAPELADKYRVEQVRSGYQKAVR